MSQAQVDAVIDSVDETIKKRHPEVGVHNSWKMDEDYGYSNENIKQFLLGVSRRLSKRGFTFTYKAGFASSLLSKTLSQTKVAINTQTAPTTTKAKAKTTKGKRRQ